MHRSSFRLCLCAALLVAIASCTGTIGSGSEDADHQATTPDAGPATDAAPGAVDAARQLTPDANAGDPTPDATDIATLADVSGCFLTVNDLDSTYVRNIGVAGVQYEWIAIEYDVQHGGWREDLFDREILNHNLLGMKRNVPAFVGRYILGNAAQIRPGTNGLTRKSLFYGRVDLEEKPNGLGYTGYTAWRTNMAWTPGETYHIRVHLDAIGNVQTLEVHHNGAIVATTIGDIDYFEPSLTAATFQLSFGGEESEGREVKPVGWTFCDLRVEAKPL